MVHSKYQRCGGTLAGFRFPICNGDLAVTVNGPAGATGSVTLTITGGMLGDKTATIGQVLALANLLDLEQEAV